MSQQGKAIPMHAAFPSWMREFELLEDAEARQRRWAGVTAVAADAGTEDVEALVRLAFKTRQRPAAAALLGFVELFAEADPANPLQGSDRELEVLAAACLVVLLEDPYPNVAAGVALAITTASAGGARKPTLPMDLVGLAENALRVQADANGLRPDLGRHAATVPVLSLDAAIAKFQETPDATGMAAALKLIGDAMQTGLRAVAKNQEASFHATATFLAQQDEELQMLWWLTGGRSWDFGCAFAEIPAAVRPLVLANELAAHTKLAPGPNADALKGILSHAGVGGEDALLSAAIGAAEAAWLAKLVPENEPSPVTMPIHFAIRRQLETGPGNAWVAGWAAATDIPATQEYSQLALAECFYRERVLSWLWSS